MKKRRIKMQEKVVNSEVKELDLSEMSEEEILELGRQKAQEVVAERIGQYKDLILNFEDAIESYGVLIEIVKENKDRFRVRYSDIVEQFSATVNSFQTQLKNIKKEFKLLEKIKNNPDKYSAKDIFEKLKL
jgi:SepF-like predicted cell division protein (DUF552 family)